MTYNRVLMDTNCSLVAEKESLHSISSSTVRDRSVILGHATVDRTDLRYQIIPVALALTQLEPQTSFHWSDSIIRHEAICFYHALAECKWKASILGLKLALGILIKPEHLLALWYSRENAEHLTQAQRGDLLALLLADVEKALQDAHSWSLATWS
jgi:hypothetical protein